jgi:Plant transposon protein
LECLVDGSFKTLEEAAGVVPFDVGGKNFNALFALVDGIYSRYSRFVKGISMPVTAEEIAFLHGRSRLERILRELLVCCGVVFKS